MATVCKGPNWLNHEQFGTLYSLVHLQPIFSDYIIPAVAATTRKPGRAALTVKLQILYSHHCFTQALDKANNPDSEQHYICSARGETRVFCENRWRESLALPEIISNLSTCYFTRHHNYFVIRNPSNLALGDYFVYFTVKLNRSGNFVDIEIESAYPRLDGQRALRAKKVGFSVLIVNAVRGVSTHSP